MLILHLVKRKSNAITTFLEADKTSDKVLEIIDGIKNDNKELQDASLQAKWIAYNAKGIARMYIDDNNRESKYDEKGDILNNLTEANEYFKKGSVISPNNWALMCNTASVNMRLYYYFKVRGDASSTKYFYLAEKILQDVVDRVRPGYDFAYYELGRLYRIKGNVSKALELFDLASNKGGSNNNVSIKTIQEQKNAALNNNFHFWAD
jgi:tetratricopeptide (TPR) repeat protein